MARKCAVLRTVDECPGMLDPDAHRKRFLRHHYALGEKSLDGIPGRMPDAQDYGICQEFPANAGMGQYGTLHMTVAADQFLQAGFKKNGATERNDFLPYGCDNVFKTIGSDMAVSITGLAGPGGGTRKKPVGLVYIAVADENGALCRKYIFNGTRTQIKHRAAMAALSLALDRLKESPQNNSEETIHDHDADR